MSKNSDAILAVIEAGYGHLTAEQIFMQVKSRLPGIALATVYNNLNAMVEKKQIRKITVQGMTDVYDKAEFRHDHLVCDRCGKLTDIVLKDFTEKLKKETGMEIVSYDLNIHYVCEECREKMLS